jgi:prolyl 4-hydroxylase
MKRIDLKDKTNFIGSWNIDNNDLCKNIINFLKIIEIFKKRELQFLVNEEVKKSTDISIDPKNLNDPELVYIKNYFRKLFDCYQDYKIQWPFLDKI